MSNRLRNLARAALAAVVVSTAAPGAALTVDVVQQNGGSVFKKADGSGAWQQTTKTNFGDFAAGMFRLKGSDGVGNFVAFCVDLGHWLKMPSVYTFDHELFAGPMRHDVSALVSNALSLVTDSRSAAAFQIALWEIITDRDGFDLDGGGFKVTNAPTGKALAAVWLTNIASKAWTAGGGAFTFLRADGSGAHKSQDLLALGLTPVPAPATAWLLGGAVAAFAALRRRSRGRAA